MKKFWMLALCLLLLAAPALASGAEGTTKTIDGLFALTHSSDLQTDPVGEADLEDGLLYVAYDEAGDFELTVYRYANEEGEDAESLFEDYNSSGELSDVEIMELADMPAVFYRTDASFVTVTLVAENGYLYDLVFNYPEGEAGFSKVQEIIASLAPAQDAPAQ